MMLSQRETTTLQIETQRKEIVSRVEKFLQKQKLASRFREGGHRSRALLIKQIPTAC